MERATLEYLDERRLVTLYENSRYSFMRQGMSEAEGLERLIYYKADDEKSAKRIRRMDKKFQIWKETAGDQWEEKLSRAKQEAAAKKVAEREAADKRQRERESYAAGAEARRRRQLNNIVLWTKRVTPYALGLIGILSVYVLFRLTMLMATLPWLGIGKTAVKVVIAIPVAFGWLIYMFFKTGWDVVTHLWRMGPMFSGAEKGTMMALPFVGAILMKLSRKCDLEIGFTKWVFRFGDALSRVVLFLGKPFEYVAIGIVEFIKFVVEYVMLFKKDHCPKINWSSK